MPINMPQPKNQSDPLSKVVQGYIGYQTGGVGGAVAGAAEGSALGQLGAMMRRKPQQDAPQAEQSESPMSEEYSKMLQDKLSIGQPASNQGIRVDDEAMSRRLDASRQQDPMYAIHDGLDALKDPSVPQHLRDQYAPLFLQVKHFKGPIA